MKKDEWLEKAYDFMDGRASVLVNLVNFINSGLVPGRLLNGASREEMVERIASFITNTFENSRVRYADFTTYHGDNPRYVLTPEDERWCIEYLTDGGDFPVFDPGFVSYETRDRRIILWISHRVREHIAWRRVVKRRTYDYDVRDLVLDELLSVADLAGVTKRGASADEFIAMITDGVLDEVRDLVYD